MIEDKLSDLKIIEELRNNTLSALIQKHSNLGGEWGIVKVSLNEVRYVLYEESKKMAQNIFGKVF